MRNYANVAGDDVPGERVSIAQSLRSGACEDPPRPDTRGLRAEPEGPKINPVVLNWAGQRRAKFAQQCIYPSSTCCSSSHCRPLQLRSTSEATVSHEIDC